MDPVTVQRLQAQLIQLAQQASKVGTAQARTTVGVTPQQTTATQRATRQAAAGFATTSKQATQATQAVKGFGGAMQEAGRGISHAAGKVLLWSVATGAIYGSLQALRGAVETINDVDFALTGLRKVYAGNIADLGQMKRAAVDMAMAYGSGISDVLNGMRDWARQGYRARDVIELTRVSLLAQNIAEMDAVQATRYLTAALNQFDLEATQAITVLDTWNELSNRYAATTQDIAEGTARLGRTAHDAGLSIQEASAMVAVLVEQTKRSGQEIGTAMRTVLTYAYRERNVKELEKIGIYVRRERGELLAMMDVLTQLSVKWEVLSDTQRQAIAEAFGVRRVTEFRTLIQGMPAILEATRIAYDSQGSALRENIIFLDSLQVRYGRLKAALQALAVGTETQDTLKSIVSVLTSLVTVVDKVGIKTIFAAGALVLITRYTQAYSAALITFHTQMVLGTQAVAAGTVTMAAWQLQVNAATLALQRFWVTLGPVGWAVAAVGVAFGTWKAIDAYVYRHERAARGLERQAEDIEQTTLEALRREEAGYRAQVDALTRRAELIQSLRDQYEAVGKSTDKAADKQKQMAKILELLQAATGDASLALRDGLAPAFGIVERAAQSALIGITDAMDKMRASIAQTLRGQIQGIRGDIELRRDAVDNFAKAAERERKTVLGMFDTIAKGQKLYVDPFAGVDRKDAEAVLSRTHEMKDLSGLQTGVTNRLSNAVGEYNVAAGRRIELEGTLKTTEQALLELEMERADLPKRIVSDPDPLGTKKAGKSLRSYQNQVRSVINLVRELQQAMRRMGAEGLGPWYQEIQRFDQTWEDMQDRALMALDQINETLSEDIPAQARKALLGARDELVGVLNTFATQYPLEFQRAWERALHIIRGGAEALQFQLREYREELEKTLADWVRRGKITPDQATEMQRLATLTKQFEVISKSADLLERQYQFERQITELEMGKGWEFSRERAEMLRRDVEQAAGALTALLLAARAEGAVGETIGEIITEMRAKASDLADALLTAEQKLVGANAAVLDFRDGIVGLGQDLELFLLDRLGDVTGKIKYLQDIFQRALDLKDVNAQIAAFRSLVELHQELVEVQYDYLKLQADTDTFQQFALLQQRYGAMTDPRERIRLWKEMQDIQRDYADWQREVAAGMEDYGLDPVARTTREIERLWELLEEFPLTTEEGRGYFDELLSRATQFGDAWRAEVKQLSSSFSDAMADAIQGTGDLTEAIAGIFEDIGREWLRTYISRQMEGVFEELNRAAYRARGEPVDRATDIMGRLREIKLPEKPELPALEGLDLQLSSLGQTCLDAATKMEQSLVAIDADTAAIIEHTRALVESAQQIGATGGGGADFNSLLLQAAAGGGGEGGGIPGGGDYGVKPWQKSVIGAAGLYSAYETGSPMAGMVGGALAFGPWGAVAGLGLGILGKRKKKKEADAQQAAFAQKLMAKYGAFWSPPDVMWSTTPFLSAMDYPAYASYRGYAAPKPSAAYPTVSAAWTAPTRYPTVTAPQFDLRELARRIQPITVNLHGTGYTARDARQIAVSIQREQARLYEREQKAGVRVR